MTRVAYLDRMKGIAIFLMVMGHVLLFTFGSNRGIWMNISFINMPIFFYVSGYLLYKEINTRNELVNRLLHKAKRLLPPWIITTIVMTSIEGQLCVWGGVFDTFCEFYWFFYVLFLLTLIVLIMEFVVFRHIKNSYLYLLSLMLIPIVFASIKFSGSYKYVPAPYLCQYSIPFLLGWSCRKYTKLNTFILENRVLYMFSMVTFLFCWYKAESMNNYLLLLGALSGIIMLQSVLYHKDKAVNRTLPFISRIGKSSLAIYILNNYFLPDLHSTIFKSWVTGNGLVPEFIIVGCITTAVILCCLIVEALFHNNKYLSYIL